MGFNGAVKCHPEHLHRQESGTFEKFPFKFRGKANIKDTNDRLFANRIKNLSTVEIVIGYIGKYMYTRKNTCYRTATGAVSA